MPDMLVKLYNIPDLDPVMVHMFSMDVQIRRALAPEKKVVIDWVQQKFMSHYWASECDIAFSRQPVGCFVAIKNNQLLGFACYDTTLRGIFGPMGVDEQARGFQIGRALLLTALHDMKQVGYGYAVIGLASEENKDFYRHVARATVIEHSTPGIYNGLLHD